MISVATDGHRLVTFPMAWHPGKTGELFELMKTNTVKTIRMVLRLDPTVKPEERMAILEIAMGKRSTKLEIDLASFYSVAEAASFLGLNRNTILWQINHDRITAERRGKKFFILGAELMRVKGGPNVEGETDADEAAEVENAGEVSAA